MRLAAHSLTQAKLTCNTQKNVTIEHDGVNAARVSPYFFQHPEAAEIQTTLD